MIQNMQWSDNTELLHTNEDKMEECNPRGPCTYFCGDDLMEFFRQYLSST